MLVLAVAIGEKVHISLPGYPPMYVQVLPRHNGKRTGYRGKIRLGFVAPREVSFTHDSLLPQEERTT